MSANNRWQNEKNVNKMIKEEWDEEILGLNMRRQPAAPENMRGKYAHDSVWDMIWPGSYCVDGASRSKRSCCSESYCAALSKAVYVFQISEWFMTSMGGPISPNHIPRPPLPKATRWAQKEPHVWQFRKRLLLWFFHRFIVKQTSFLF